MKPRFRPSLAETKRQTQAALDFYRLTSAREDAPRIDVGATPKRERAAPNPETSEGPVLAAVGKLLACHPGVCIAIRINSGMAFNAAGAPVWFHKLYRGDGLVVDYVGLLKSGTTFAIECKPPQWKWSEKNRNYQREVEQSKFLATVKAANGLAGFARSVDEAMEILGASAT